MTCYDPDLGSTSDWLKICFKQSETLTRSPSDASSVWNFCAQLVSHSSFCRENSASGWLKICFNQSRVTTQIWLATGHLYGFSVLVSQTSFHRKTSGGVTKCHLFSKTTDLKRVTFDPQIKYLLQFCFRDYHQGKDKVFYGHPFSKRIQAYY